MARKNKILLGFKWVIKDQKRQGLRWKWLKGSFSLESWLLHYQIYLPRLKIIGTIFCRHFSLNVMYFGRYIISKLEPAPSASQNYRVSLLLARNFLWVPDSVSSCLGLGILLQRPWFFHPKFWRQMLHFTPTFLAFLVPRSRIITAKCWRLCHLQKSAEKTWHHLWAHAWCCHHLLH